MELYDGRPDSTDGRLPREIRNLRQKNCHHR